LTNAKSYKKFGNVLQQQTRIFFNETHVFRMVQ